MRKFTAAALVAAMTAGLTGCATVQKKFTRKPKEPKHRRSVIYIDEGPYQKKYSNDYYYKTHYTMWKTWHDELLLQLGGNRKKVARCAQESYGHLVELSRYLVPEKAAGLKAHIDEMRRIKNRLENQAYSDSEEASLRGDIERVKRLVANDYYYNKVKESLLPDDIDLGGSASNVPAAPAAAQPQGASG